MSCKRERDQTLDVQGRWRFRPGVCEAQEYRLEEHNVRGVHGPAVEELRGRTLLR